MTKNQNKATLFALGAIMMWSTVATAFKLALSHMTPAQLLLFSSLSSCVILTAILVVQGKLKQIKPQFCRRPIQYLQSALLGPFAYYLLLFGAYELLPAQQAQPLTYTWTIVLTLLAVPFLGQKLKVWDMVAAIVAYSGVVVIATGGNFGSLQFEQPLGISLALLSTLMWALYWIVNAKDQGDPVISLLLSFVIALPFIAIVCWQQNVLSLPSWEGMAAAVYVGWFEMGITFVIWLQALRRAEHTAALTNMVFLVPFLSLFFISNILGEPIAPATFIGLGFIIFGLIVQQLGPKLKTRITPTPSD